MFDSEKDTIAHSSCIQKTQYCMNAHYYWYILLDCVPILPILKIYSARYITIDFQYWEWISERKIYHGSKGLLQSQQLLSAHSILFSEYNYYFNQWWCGFGLINLRYPFDKCISVLSNVSFDFVYILTSYN